MTDPAAINRVRVRVRARETSRRRDVNRLNRSYARTRAGDLSP